MVQQFAQGYALLIAVDQNKMSGLALPDVAKDISAMARVLTEPERCAYPASNVRTLTGQEATRQGILDGLGWLQERIQADQSGNATVVFYYSGHGWRDLSVDPPQFYLIPYDMRSGSYRSSALRAEDLAEEVAGLKAQRVLVLLDCCHAAGMGVKELQPVPMGYAAAAVPPTLLMKGEKAASGPAAKGVKGIEELALGKGRAVLSSSSGEQSSYLRKDGAMSIFTYHLIEALTGHAQPEEGASEVLVSDVMSYVWRHVPKSAMQDWKKEQQPDYQVSGNFPIALLLGGKGLGRGQPAPDPLTMVASGEAKEPTPTIHANGAVVVGKVEIRKGNFVGRDQIVTREKRR